ncbi:hypothetical protein SYNPS1DRAFT_13376 [Syncephalis pseudoplumigaleata]|uniref:JmjC domain-containing protein n=1 Tax=Syncephalis pseudoplumigaleata TaxID=1712513 RepID=A0A4P9Z375_9FUNG|nr:hypothetical protein SYNPS1DRAFT_13376 [Syncephalis pseudoplumigaleata]|eukprot:RKP26974.1 hypothetical protein SYNPS1DRAFT_13376 [Syncephalis pseudoplumigaleata]
MQQWPAMTRWAEADYLLEVLGRRWVPVEIGRRYTDAQWQQKLMPLADFLRDYVVEGAAMGYLAQHDLFRQVPRLRHDIHVPDYCYAVETSTGTVQTHAWFGPAGTTSPLHYDPDHNLFAQVVGRKQFRLYAPDQPVYPHATGTMLHNTSQVDGMVDVEAPCWEAFPAFAQAQGYDCTLQPGDLLYIPPLWWHYVRALDTSFSVSFWF